jgi:RNA polymerase sigma-70 factor (ECF subfamily)
MPSRSQLRSLVNLIATGNRPAFVQLFDALAPKAYADLAVHGLPRTEAEQVVSAAFVEVWWLARFHTGKTVNIEHWITGVVARRGTERALSVNPTNDDQYTGSYQLASVTLANLLAAPTYAGPSDGSGGAMAVDRSTIS